MSMLLQQINFSVRTQQKIGFCQCNFFLDRKHLLKDENMEKKFGSRAYHDVKHYVRDMVYADSVEVFDSFFEEAKKILKELTPRQGDAKTELDIFASQKKNYSTHELQTVPGNRMRHGSSLSEINHTNVLIFK